MKITGSMLWGIPAAVLAMLTLHPAYCLPIDQRWKREICRGRHLVGDCRRDWCDTDPDHGGYDRCWRICNHVARTCPSTTCIGFVEKCMEKPIDPPTPAPTVSASASATLAPLEISIIVSLCFVVAFVIPFILWKKRESLCDLVRKCNRNGNQEQPLLRADPSLPAVRRLDAITEIVDETHDKVTLTFEDPSRGLNPSKRATHYLLTLSKKKDDAWDKIESKRVLASGDDRGFQQLLDRGARYGVKVVPILVRDFDRGNQAPAASRGPGHRVLTGLWNRLRALRNCWSPSEKSGESTNIQFFTHPPAPRDVEIVDGMVDEENICLVPPTNIKVEFRACQTAYGDGAGCEYWIRVSGVDGVEVVAPVRVETAAPDGTMTHTIPELGPGRQYTAFVYSMIEQLASERVRTQEILLKGNADPKTFQTGSGSSGVQEASDQSNPINPGQQPFGTVARVTSNDTDSARAALRHHMQNHNGEGVTSNTSSSTSSPGASENDLPASVISHAHSEGPQQQV